MSNFLQSSPSRQLLDSQGYSFSDQNEGTRLGKTDSGSSTNNPSANKLLASTSKSKQQQQQSSLDISSVPPSAQKFYPGGITGWTPLISKTIFNDQLVSYNSPNTSKWNSHNMHQLGASNTDMDFAQGLSLTPFLTHNLQSVGFGSAGPGSASGLGNSGSMSAMQITPFHDKTLHLADFFMDSPIRQTPLKDLDTITPSKFKIQSVEKKSVKQLLFQDAKNSQSSKRSITQVDTPPRQPYKLSNLSISANVDSEAQGKDNDDGGDADNESDEDAEFEKSNLGAPGVITTDEEEDEDDEDENDEDEDDEGLLEGKNRDSKNKSKSHPNKSKSKKNALKEIKQSYLNQQTPSKNSKKYSDSSIVNTKTPLRNSTSTFNSRVSANANPSSKGGEFVTPHKPISASSPSTVIMSSTTKSPTERAMAIPPSPTPKKDSNTLPCKKIIDGDSFKPAMGVFSETNKVPAPKPKMNKYGGGFSTMSGTSSSGGNPQNLKSHNKAQMQAGMNKFQIVFTDVHTLMNGKGKKKSDKGKKKEEKQQHQQQAQPSQHSSQEQMHIHHQQQQQQQQQQHLQHQLQVAPSSQMVAPAAEISLMSINNNSMNTSHLNMSSTDHSSFELGGTSSTPNSKFFLDKMFDKPSPSQGKSAQIQQQLLLQQQQQQQQQQQFPFYAMQQQMYGNMPPPSTNRPQNPQQPAQQNYTAQQPFGQPMLMMMSTPQHQNVINYNGYNSNNETSPNSDHANSGRDNQFGNLSYQALQASFSKDQGVILDPALLQHQQSSQSQNVSRSMSLKTKKESSKDEFA